MNANAFQLSSSWTKKPDVSGPDSSTQTKTPAKSSKKGIVLWRIITHSERIQERLVDMVNELGDADYGPSETPFKGKFYTSVTITEEMVDAITSGTDSDFILLSRPNINSMWSYSQRSRGDMTKYFGSKVARDYDSAIPSSPSTPKK